MDKEIKVFAKGIHNLLDDEIIPDDAAADSQNFLTQDGRIKLIPGKVLEGNVGVAGKITGEIFGYKADGSKVHWAKRGTKIQYLLSGTWTDVVTGLTSAADYSFANYSSLAGTFTYAFGVDGIYKFHNAVPGDYLSMYDSAKNFKGLAFIDKGRTILWNRAEDLTGLYGSKIDLQKVGTQYTQVTAEVLYAFDGTFYGGTLAGKGVSATGPLTSTGVAPANNDTVTIGSTVYTYKTTLTGAAYEVLIGTSAAAALDNLKSAINATAGAGTTYGTGTVAHPTVYAVTNTNTTQVVVAKLGGTAGNSIASTEVSAQLSWGGATLSGGSSNATRNVFGVTIAGTTGAGTETFTDNYLGVLTSNLGGTGTINYLTGAYQVTFNGAVTSGNVTATYKWEDSNTNGLTDFSFSGTRLASEGFIISQDEGGDPILNVLIGLDETTNGTPYYSMKKNSAYKFSIDSTDLNPSNDIYRKGIGIQSYRGAYSSSKGIIFMNLSNPERPELTLLEKNLVGDNLVPKVLFSQFKFANYIYDDCTIFTYERYALVACKTLNATNNDTLLLCDLTGGTIDVTTYAGRTFANNGTYLYMGSSVGESIYQLFSGFDDDGFRIDAFWKGKGQTWGSELLKKYRKLRLKGNIGIDQGCEVYINYDGSGAQLVGTILGTGSYVDYSSPQTIGSNFIGSSQVGGDTLTSIYPYFLEIRLKKVPKFRKRQVSFVPTGIGYLDIDSQIDHDIETYQNKLPTRFRQKQNVSLDGATVNQDNPEF